MIFNKIYKISIFGAFQAIEATPDNMSYFLSEFGGQGLMPSIFQEIQISGINQVMKKRIALVSSNDSTKIMIGSERIDYEMVGKLKGVDEYYQTLNELNAPARLSGSFTSELELALKGKFSPKNLKKHLKKNHFLKKRF